MIIIGASVESLQDDIATDNVVAFADPFDLSDFLSTVEEIHIRPLEDVASVSVFDTFPSASTARLTDQAVC